MSQRTSRKWLAVATGLCFVVAVVLFIYQNAEFRCAWNLAATDHGINCLGVIDVDGGGCVSNGVWPEEHARKHCFEDGFRCPTTGTEYVVTFRIGEHPYCPVHGRLIEKYGWRPHHRPWKWTARRFGILISVLLGIVLGVATVVRKMRRRRLIAAVVGCLALGCLVLLLVAPARRPRILHQQPYRWDQYVIPTLWFDGERWPEVVAAINEAVSKASQGEVTEAVRLDTTPTRIVKVNCAPELEPYVDEFIAAYREHEIEMNRLGVTGFEGAPCTGLAVMEGHSIGSTLPMLAGHSGLGYAETKDFMLLGRMPSVMECRPYLVTDDLVERMRELKREGGHKVHAEPVVSTLVKETGIYDSWKIQIPDGAASGAGEYRFGYVFRYLPHAGIILALTTPEEHAEAEKQLKASGLWIDPASETGIEERSRKLLSEANRREIELGAGREEYGEDEYPPEPVGAAADRVRAGTLTLDLGGGVTMDLVPIPAGEFLMGSPGKQCCEGPQRRMKITKPFYIGKYEVTQAQYEQIMGENPSHFKNPSNPVEMVSWDDAAEFCRRLSERSGRKVRLPTEPEWEYAARAGSVTRFCFGDNPEGLADYTCFKNLWCRKTHPVGRWRANAWGLYDSHGNVREWCAGWYEDYYYNRSPGEDRGRVLRGGAWGHPAKRRCSASRAWGGSGSGYKKYGFRVVVETADR